MNAIADQLADALRAAMPLIEAEEKRTEDVPGNFAREALAAYDAQRAQEPARPRICIKLEGGVIQNVFADQDASVYVIRYDDDEIEDARGPHGFEDEDNAVCQLEQDGGGTAECLLNRYGAEVAPDWFPRMDRALAARAAELDEAEEAEAPRP